MLQKDGYLEEDLAPYPVGLEECLTMKFGMNRWNGLHVLWIRDEDKSTKSEPTGNELPPLVALPTPRFFRRLTRKL